MNAEILNMLISLALSFMVVEGSMTQHTQKPSSEAELKRGKTGILCSPA